VRRAVWGSGVVSMIRLGHLIPTAVLVVREPALG
jgi:hypothetical protein